MLTRLLKAPSESIFLFGPRGTGKSTWIRRNFPRSPTYDLLDTRESLRLAKEPHLLYQELSAIPRGEFVIIDEIQKVPALLDEVHRLIENRGLRFIMSSSSTRKIRRGGANLLAGRALTRTMFPIVSMERGFDLEIEECLLNGSLPLAVTSESPKDYLASYVETYLDQEIRAEALTRNLGGFSRFLEVAARQNGQVTNTSGIARDAGVGRTTVQGYFEILVDTLIGFFLPPWNLKPATKQVRHSKFYFFDSGVCRALTGRLPYPPTPEELGPLLETYLLHEVRAYLSYTGRGYRLNYWRTYDGAEVDLVCETAEGFVGIDMKASRRWDKRFNRGLRRLRRELGARSLTCYGVFLGDRPMRFDEIDILPVRAFLERLWDGRLLP